ncbi:MAG: hypothetical protein CM15mP77_1470 [Synechococcus sp.]|nr:MAG: hypothetical protein CM15mP77_1470 [Synechococcus sp.]
MARFFRSGPDVGCVALRGSGGFPRLELLRGGALYGHLGSVGCAGRVRPATALGGTLPWGPAVRSGVFSPPFPLIGSLGVNARACHTPGWRIRGWFFAKNSSIHSYMVLAYTDAESVSLNVGFYYMANAAGRLIGTLLSGAVFMLGRTESGGMQACL